MVKILIINIIFLFSSIFLFSKEQFKEELPQTINSYYPTILPVISFDGRYLYFDRKLHPENTNSLEDFDEIWYSKKNKFGFWSDPIKLKDVNSPYSDALFYIFPDGSKALIYSTIEQDNQKKSGFAFADRIDDSIFNIQFLNIKNFYNLSPFFYATISFDTKVIILSIQRNDSFGKKDLYVSFYDEINKEWTEPQNLTSLNTAEEEEAPFLAYDNRTLYFSSNGRNGYGRKDIFVTRRLDDTWLKWSEPINVGSNINTTFDENCFYLNSTSDTAYFFSYSEEKKRSSIFIASIPDSVKPFPYFIFYGKINFIDSLGTKYNINKRVTILFKDKADNTEYKFYSSPQYSDIYAILPVNKEYSVYPHLENYITESFDINTYSEKITIFQKEINFRSLNKNLQPSEEKKLISENKSRTEIIYFDFDSYLINEISSQKLIELINSLKRNEIKKITITGHADTIGTESYNNILSKKRAITIYNFLIKNKIPSKKIEVKWEGSKKPISDDFSKNRRVEIIIYEK